MNKGVIQVGNELKREWSTPRQKSEFQLTTNLRVLLILTRETSSSLLLPLLELSYEKVYGP